MTINKKSDYWLFYKGKLNDVFIDTEGNRFLEDGAGIDKDFYVKHEII